MDSSADGAAPVKLCEILPDSPHTYTSSTNGLRVANMHPETFIGGHTLLKDSPSSGSIGPGNEEAYYSSLLGQGDCVLGPYDTSPLSGVSIILRYLPNGQLWLLLEIFDDVPVAAPTRY